MLTPFGSEQRIQQMMAQAARNKFGDIQPIAKDEWTREVTEGSKENWVIAYLWDDALEECKLMDQVLRVVAKNHRDVKFVSIQAQACIENWPQRYVGQMRSIWIVCGRSSCACSPCSNCPTLFMYHEGALQNQILGIRKLGGLNMKVEGTDMEYCMVFGCMRTAFSDAVSCCLCCRSGGAHRRGRRVQVLLSG